MYTTTLQQPHESFIRQAHGVHTPLIPVQHRDDEYDSASFDILRDMQGRHFWYRGRHRFLWHAVRRTLAANLGTRPLRAIDLGGGCGGWFGYLQGKPRLFSELALADSSMQALEYAESVVGPSVDRYQVNLLDLPWRNHWDAVFLLDVLEHIPDDLAAMKQLHQVLRPGGYAFVTTPAFNRFRTSNDDLVHHVRRYVRSDFIRLAQASGFEHCRSLYFMFFLSPLLLLSRLKRLPIESMTQEEIQAYLERMHRVPAAPINAALSFVFGLETPLGSWLPFPWGTSILGIFRKP